MATTITLNQQYEYAGSPGMLYMRIAYTKDNTNVDSFGVQLPNYVIRNWSIHMRKTRPSGGGTGPTGFTFYPSISVRGESPSLSFLLCPISQAINWVTFPEGPSNSLAFPMITTGVTQVPKIIALEKLYVDAVTAVGCSGSAMAGMYFEVIGEIVTRDLIVSKFV